VIKRIIKGKEHIIYKNIAELRQAMSNIKVYDDWRTAPLDSWVLTDDEQVCQILEKGNINNISYVRTAIGMFKCAPFIKIEGEPKENIYNFSGLNINTRTKLRKNPTKQELLFAKYMVKGEGVLDAFKKAFPDAKSEEYIQSRSTALMKTERIQTLIDKEVEKYLEQSDITPQYLLEKTKEIVDKEDARDADKLASIKILMEISGLLGKKEQKTESLALFQGFTPEQLKLLDGGNNVKKIAEQTRTVSDVSEED
jgi:hypothetical protein|tara:strand:- start:225 stop:986 length:762 start_codon:yes stop_codon:yes gene_type:complete